MKAAPRADPAAGKAYPAAPRLAVGGVVFNGRGEVLLVQRRDPPSQGEWAIPGGAVALGETLQGAAEREVLEETGVRIRARDPVYVFETIDRDPEGRVRHHYVVVDLAADHLEGEPEARDDALDARWVTPEELDRLPVNRTTLHLLRGVLGFGDGH